MIDENVRAKFRAKVKAAARELGLEAEKINITYSEHGFTFRGQIFEGDAGRAEAFAHVAQAKGFPSSWYKKVFNDDGVSYQITGAAARGRTYPILVKRVSDGAPFKYSISAVRKGLPLNMVTEPLKITRI